MQPTEPTQHSHKPSGKRVDIGSLKVLWGDGGALAAPPPPIHTWEFYRSTHFPMYNRFFDVQATCINHAGAEMMSETDCSCQGRVSARKPWFNARCTTLSTWYISCISVKTVSGATIGQKLLLRMKNMLLHRVLLLPWLSTSCTSALRSRLGMFITDCLLH